MWSFQESSVIGTSIFLFLAANMPLVPIFVENLTFLNFGEVGMGVVVPRVSGHRDQHFPFPRTKYGIGIDFPKKIFFGRGIFLDVTRILVGREGGGDGRGHPTPQTNLGY